MIAFLRSLSGGSRLTTQAFFIAAMLAGMGCGAFGLDGTNQNRADHPGEVDAGDVDGGGRALDAGDVDGGGRALDAGDVDGGSSGSSTSGGGGGLQLDAGAPGGGGSGREVDAGLIDGGTGLDVDAGLSDGGG